MTSPAASTDAFFPGEEIEVSLTHELGACPPHVAGLRVGVDAGTGTFARAVNNSIIFAEGPLGIAVGDLDGDGDLDIATANENSDDVSVLLNNGNGTFAAAVNYNSLGQDPSAIAVGDLDGDGDLDIATANFNSADVSVLLNNN